MAAMLYLSSTSQPRTAAGLPMPLATLTFYRSGTTALATVYDANTLVGTLTNPVVADASGVWPAIWLDPDTTYRVILNEASGVLAYDVDPYLPYEAGPFQYLDARIQAIEAGAVVPGAEIALTVGGDPASLYADGYLGSALPNPVYADSGGRFPAIYLSGPISGYPPIYPLLNVSQAAASDPVILAWTAAAFGSDPPDDYLIYVSVNSSSFSLLDTVSGAALSYDDFSGYTDGDVLLYYVSAIMVGMEPLNSNEDGITYDEEATDPYFDLVTLLLHLDGPNGSTTITDVIGHTVGVVGSQALSTSNFKFGGAAMAADASGGVLTQGSADFVPTGAWTMELWFYPTGANGSLFAFTTASEFGLYAYMDAGDLKLRTILGTTIAGTPTVNVWHHFYLEQEAGVGVRTMYSGIDGAYDTVGTGFSPSVGANPHITIGTDANITAGTLGPIDEVRLTVGVQRYTGPFIPPTEEFPNA